MCFKQYLSPSAAGYPPSFLVLQFQCEHLTVPSVCTGGGAGGRSGLSFAVGDVNTGGKVSFTSTQCPLEAGPVVLCLLLSSSVSPEVAFLRPIEIEKCEGLL